MMLYRVMFLVDCFSGSCPPESLLPLPRVVWAQSVSSGAQVAAVGVALPRLHLRSISEVLSDSSSPLLGVHFPQTWLLVPRPSGSASRDSAKLALVAQFPNIEMPCGPL